MLTLLKFPSKNSLFKYNGRKLTELDGSHANEKRKETLATKLETKIL